jgi:methyl-accepting chemotaxis protein
MTREEIRQVIEENRAALVEVRQESQRVATSTEEIRESVQEPLRVLREAGVISEG